MLKRNPSIPFFTATAIIVWIFYTCVYSILKTNPGTATVAGYFSLIGETGLDIVAALLTIRLWKKFKNHQIRNYFLIFFLAFIAAIAADCIYNIALNLLHFQYSNTTAISLFDIPFALFLLFQLIAWGWLLFAKKEDLNQIRKSIYTPYAIVSILLFAMFMFGIPWKIDHYSMLGIFQCIDTLLEVTGFYLATICLARAKTDEFFSALNEIDISSPIFIDSDLKNNVKGQELVIKVRALNFKKIYLTTGYEPESFAFIPGLTAIVGKHPPKEIGGVGNDMQ